MSKLSRFTILFAVSAMAAPRLARSGAAGERDLSSLIEGTLRLDGCVVASSQLRVIAEPLRLATREFRAPILDPSFVPPEAELRRTTDPHLFAFTIAQADPLTLYRLRVGFPPSPCGRVFWRGPAQGLAVAGQRSLVIEGFAARTTVEVRETGTTRWVGADDLRFDDPSKAVRTFRFRSTLEDVVEGELQVSTEAFPIEGDFGPCDEPRKGIVLRERIPAARLGTLARVDFGALLTPDRRDRTTYDRLQAGKPLYVRVVPIRSDGPACDVARDGVHGWVMLAKLPASFRIPPPTQSPGAITPGDNQHYEPPYLGQPFAGHPTYDEVAYKVIKPHKAPSSEFCTHGGFSADPMGCFLVSWKWVDPGAEVGVGTWFFYLPHYKSGGGGGFFSGLASSIGNLVTATFGALGAGVEFFHNLTEEVKQAVAQIAADVITQFPGAGQLCDDLSPGDGDCADLVKTGIETGLVAMGIPPSIPSWDELKKQGTAYLATLAASEIEKVTHVPPAVSELVLEAMAQKVLNQMGDNREGAGGGTKYDWLVPYAGFEPAVWTVTIRKNVAGPLPNVHLETQANLYVGSDVALPIRFPPNDVLRIPIVLQPSFSGIIEPHCYIKLGHTPVCFPSVFAPSLCSWQTFENYSPKGWHWETYPCTQHILSVYYRNAWTLQKYIITPYAVLSARAYLNGPTLKLDWPFDYPFHELALPHPYAAATWDGAFYFAQQ
jgi:hypothetical protein